MQVNDYLFMNESLEDFNARKRGGWTFWNGCHV